MTEKLDYQAAGVNIEAGNEAVRLLAPLAAATFDSRVLTDIGGFSGLYSLSSLAGTDPVLVSSTDGVGTKLKVAILADKHETIGQDLVAMSVNDILAQGARPLFFLDYLATGKLNPAKVALIVGGIAQGCKLAGCALIGGETAEMPDMYRDGDYDLAGFAVGLVERDKIIDGSSISLGDQVIGLGSSGLHSNGYSLVRKVIFEKLGLPVESAFLGRTVAEELLTPTRIYVPQVLVALKRCRIHGLAHITGGGLLENPPRILPAGCRLVLERRKWPELPIFEFLRRETALSDEELYRTFNMGIGMVLVLPESETEEALGVMAAHNQPAWVIGHVERHDSVSPRVVIK